MPILSIFAPILGWLFREVIFKFGLFGLIFVAMALFVPWIMALMVPFLSPTTLTDLFASVPAGMWYFWDMANLGAGLPLYFSALIARFLIRRIPFFG